MSSDELVSYLKQSVLAGHSLKKVRQAMSEAGWREEEIEHAIREAKKPKAKEQRKGSGSQLDLKLVLAALAILIALAVIAYILLFGR